MLQGAYTFGKAMNDADIAVGTTNFQDAADLGAEWAIAGYDVRHKLALVGVWEMPFFKNSTGLTRTLARRLAARRLGDLPDRQPDQHHEGRLVPDAATTTPTATAAIGPTRPRAA